MHYQVDILAVEGCYLSCAAGFADVLQAANAHLRQQQGPNGRPFAWRFVSAGGGAVAASNGLAIKTEPLRGQRHADVIFVPAIHYPGFKPFARFLDAHGAVYDWLRTQWQRGASIGANCTGTFVLAQSGLLDGRTATTTWWLDRQFRSRYPRVDLQYKSVLTEVDRLLCAGATATYLLQAVRIVERCMGPALAAETARSMLIDVSQTGHVPYLPLLVQTRHGDSLVERAQHWLRQHMAEDVSMAALARAVGASERTLARRFVVALAETPLAHLQALRLDAARALLEVGDLSVQTVAIQVGYSDASSFTRLFREGFGLTPGAYRRRFQAIPNGPGHPG